MLNNNFGLKNLCVFERNNIFISALSVPPLRTLGLNVFIKTSRLFA